MRKNLFGSFGFASVLVATALVGFDTQIALACSGNGSSGSGLTHGSSLGSGSVTVCVGASGGSPGSSSTRTSTKTVVVKVPVRAKPPPAKAPKVLSRPISKPLPTQAPVSCPSRSQIEGLPRSADAAERWIASICSPQPRVSPAPRPAPKVSARPKQQFKTKTIIETITIEVPGFSYSSRDEARFSPNPLRAVMAPEKTLGIGQLASFFSNPAPHFGISDVLGRQAQVSFAPVESGWFFSDGMTRGGVETSRSFEATGSYQVKAWVSYKVSYRLLGETGWQPVDGELTVESNTLEVLVGASYPTEGRDSRGALLVGADCDGRVDAFGCRL